MTQRPEYAEFVAGKKKPGESIVDEFNSTKADLLHMAVGITKEAGELLDAVARLCFYNKELDLENVAEELGDIEFFLEGFRQRAEISRDTTLFMNMEKLGKRYASGSFSNEQANARADKEGGA